MLDLSPEHANAKFPNELHNYQKFLHHCRCVFACFSLYFFPPQNFSARTQAIQFLFISPPHPPLLERSRPRHETPPLALPHPILLLISPFSHLRASPRSLLKPILPLLSP